MLNLPRTRAFPTGGIPTDRRDIPPTTSNMVDRGRRLDMDDVSVILPDGVSWLAYYYP